MGNAFLSACLELSWFRMGPGVDIRPDINTKTLEASLVETLMSTPNPGITCMLGTGWWC